MNPATSSKTNPNETRLVWTQTVFTALKGAVDYIVVLTRRSPKDGSPADLSVRACEAAGPRVGHTFYIPPRSLNEWGANAYGTISKALAEEGIEMSACLKGLGKQGRKLYSWRAMANVVYVDMKGASGKRRAEMHLRHRYVDMELTFQGPWRMGSNDVVRKAMFEDWNLKMAGFQHIEWDIAEDELLADIGFNCDA